MPNQRLNQSPLRLAFFRMCLVVALAAITFLATTSREFPIISSVSDKINHVLAFFVLAGLTDGSFPGKKFWKVKALLLLGYGMLIECIQYFIPCREFSLLDVAADGAGLMVYQAVVKKLRITIGRWRHESRKTK